MKLYLGILLFSVLAFSLQNEKGKIVRMNQASISKEIIQIIPHVIDFKDTIPNDTLLEHIGETSIPIMFSRKILTSVCIDSECRLLNIELFWNTTGRYLGFELPAGEFLSKTKHKVFSSSEYDRLHLLLSDPLSGLAHYSIDELVPVIDSSKNKIDAVSSATIAAVLDYIVEGAVYTTYTLWHIVYGTTRHEIEKYTTERLTSEIVLELLNSTFLEDQVWALNHISDKMEINSDLKNKLLTYISGDDIYLAERSLNALKSETLNNKEIQVRLAKIFQNAGFLQKRLITQKLKNVPILYPDGVGIIAGELNKLNGSLIKNVLELFKHHQIENEEVNERVETLLKNENRYIAKQAFLFLQNLNQKNNRTLKSIEKYKRKNRMSEKI